MGRNIMDKPGNKCPELIKWNEAQMSTGFASVDEQHRELISKINELYAVHQSGATMDDIYVILKFLGDYAGKHFVHEEGLMDTFNCPVKRTNCNAHARFIMDYSRLVSDFTLDHDVDRAAGNIERMAARWLAQHICQVDIALRDVKKFKPKSQSHPLNDLNHE